MQLDRLTVHLRARTSWEAVELGTALVRRNAAAVWKPWLLATWSVWLLLNLAGWAIDALWLSALLMWWLKPVFDRIPLYVISRTVFGDTPSTWQTLRGHIGWGWGRMFAYLLWRRLGPARTLFLPIDLLEGGNAGQRRMRRRTLGSAVYAQMILTTTMFMHFELLIMLACIGGALMLIPSEFLPDSMRQVARLLESMPVWLELTLNAVAWLAVSVIEPFYVGAGFGTYLNRRTELEAWDVELSFRKLRKRLTAAVTPFALALALCWLPWHPVSAQTNAVVADTTDEQVDTTPPDGAAEAARSAAMAHAQEDTLREVFGIDWRDAADFQRTAKQTLESDPLLNGKRTVVAWERRNPSQDKPSEFGKIPGLEWLVELLAFIGKWGMWILLGILVFVVLATARYWLPWMRGSGRRAKVEKEAIRVEAVLPPETLPDDIVAEARRLWAAGKPRHALALLYRASVETMATRAQVILPPGATEAQCLRASRRMPDAADRELFARMVRIWEYAAYAWKLPDTDTFEQLTDELRQRYEWRPA